MATVFWDSKGIILIDYKPAGTSITGEYYANVIKQLRVAIKEKRRGKLHLWTQNCTNFDGLHFILSSCQSAASHV